MSEVASEVQSKFLASVPSCSHSDVYLSNDLILRVFNQMAKTTPIKEVLKLKKLCSVADNCVEKSLTIIDHIAIDIREPVHIKSISGKKEKSKTPEPVIFVQGSKFSLEAALKAVRLLIEKSTVIKNLTVCTDVQDVDILEQLLVEFINKDNVRLEVLKIRRRKGGQSIPKIAELMTANAKTLKIVGKIGLQEAADGCTADMHLDRLSLMTFDLGFDQSSSRFYDHLASISRTGATFEHISYTSFVGFDPTDEVVQEFLDSTNVKSLRLTMMKGPCIPQQPDYMVGKVRRVKVLQLGEVVEKPNIFNSLIQHERSFLKVFPNVEDIHYFQHWNN